HAAPGMESEMRRVITFIGCAVERVEDQRMLLGRGCYLDDINRPDQWHAAIVRSPLAHGRIRSIDTSAALAMPGVRAAVTARDVGKPTPTIPFRRANPTTAPYAQPVIAEHLVRYVGEPVALVLADSAERAEDAVQAVALDLEPLPAGTDRRASQAGGVVPVGGTPTNCAG